MRSEVEILPDGRRVYRYLDGDKLVRRVWYVPIPKKLRIERHAEKMRLAARRRP